MKGELTGKGEARLSGRTLAEITDDFKRHCRAAAEDILRLGADLVEAKAMCQHGQWRDWLDSVGWSERTAENYIRVFKAWQEQPKLSAFGYTKTIALLAAPDELRDQAARGELDGASAAEIRRMSKELREKEEANKNLYREIEKRDETVNGLLAQLEDADKKLRAKKEPEVIEKVVERIPEDYELLKQQLRLAEDAAEEAEQRAEEAVRQAQDAMAGEPDAFAGPTVNGFIEAVNRFLAEAQALPFAADWLRSLDATDRQAVEMFTGSVWHWAGRMLHAIEESGKLMVISGEGAVGDE